ncbi:succinate dehydrogenase assembly factor 2 [Marichromatium sp. AB31]|uniref:FAD assembly factor SdhE n=1 Tax=Marichromatium sp. AB31 TaxID=2483362 RepID=UPI000F419958|nr:succinate dehydrogenase assembly factor 2 [Marichromatium sp. AB31]MBO8085730.1 succinate dehydrogenase assembly factor 2 [Marichromatium sp.]RNE90539.1 succinate dehydrogenase assembly factor 2 [Marichromatium sp. AB31]
MTDSTPASERQRLAWQCRRGLLELDHLFSRFLELGYDDLDAAGRVAFQRLLGEQDQILNDWFMMGVEAPDPEIAVLVERILAVVSVQRD